MKKIVTISVSLVISSLAALGQAPKNHVFINKAIPKVNVQDNKRNNVELKSLHTPGVVTIVSVWNTPCLPCKQELNAVKGKIADWKKEAKIDYKIISNDDNRSVSKAIAYVVSQGWPFEDFYDTNSDLQRQLSFQEVPYTFIINKDGRIVYSHKGYKPGNEDEIFQIAKNLANK
jgi:cytochrome c biogenesis protein CcmG/thiol:disulfide interchange protein DsbE